MTTRTVLDAHLPSWLKAALLEAAAQRRTYASIGHHLAKHLEDFFEDEDIPRDRILGASDDDLAHPTRTLREIFASTRHPMADLVDLIPQKRRCAVLQGMLCEAEGDECPDCQRVLDRQDAETALWMRG